MPPPDAVRRRPEHDLAGRHRRPASSMRDVPDLHLAPRCPNPYRPRELPPHYSLLPCRAHAPPWPCPFPFPPAAVYAAAAPRPCAVCRGSLSATRPHLLTRLRASPCSPTVPCAPSRASPRPPHRTASPSARPPAAVLRHPGAPLPPLIHRHAPRTRSTRRASAPVACLLALLSAHACLRPHHRVRLLWPPLPPKAAHRPAFFAAPNSSAFPHFAPGACAVAPPASRCAVPRG
nr:WAS/WASL-interacting protein family member 3-like [Aegilops tauschii subsp. strangulata]